MSVLNGRSWDLVDTWLGNTSRILETIRVFEVYESMNDGR